MSLWYAQRYELYVRAGISAGSCGIVLRMAPSTSLPSCIQRNLPTVMDLSQTWSKGG